MSDVAAVAAGSTAIRALLTGPRRPARVLGATTHAWWCSIDDVAIVVTDDRVARLPNAVISGPSLGSDAPPWATGERVVVGAGEVLAPSRGLRIARWWEPRVPAIDADPTSVAARSSGAARRLPRDGDRPLHAALLARDPDRILERARQLIGRGGGLTPEFDDELTGAVAGYRHAGASIGDRSVAAALERVRDPLVAAARSTTLLSRSLLRHAFAGEVAGPVGSLLRALTGRGDVGTAIAATSAIGHRSGPALARGVVLGVAAGCGVAP